MTEQVKENIPDIQLTPEETAFLDQIMANIIEAKVQQILRTIATVRQEILEACPGIDFSAAMKKVAEQPGFDSSCGLTRPAGWGDLSIVHFAGGFREHVLANTLYKLGLTSNGQSSLMAGAIALRKAMTLDPDVNLYVRGILEAAKKVQGDTKDPNTLARVKGLEQILTGDVTSPDLANLDTRV